MLPPTETLPDIRQRRRRLFCYDRFGNVVRKVQSVESATAGAPATLFTTRYEYSLGGRLMRVIYPSGMQISYTRNAASRIDTMRYWPAGGGASRRKQGSEYISPAAEE